MDEFALIDRIISQLGERAQGRWVSLGPGDDAAVIDPSPRCQAVASIDTLVAGRHFPADAPAQFIGYRAMMVSLSDLAAMAATPRYVLIALTLPNADVAWVEAFAAGVHEAAVTTDVYVCGGNLAQGPLSITVSVHGEVPTGAALTRSGACPGDGLFVSGDLGGAAACVRQQDWFFKAPLSVQQRRYLRPQARFDLCDILRRAATAAIDVSDGLLADLTHLCRASAVGARLETALLPIVPDALLEDALYGGDDYQILCAAPADELPPFTRIGTVTPQAGIWIDGQPASPRGYDHFSVTT